jgi:class 3 adenylate cyclase/tetratricopeptide (TPR) repeat protein
MGIVTALHAIDCRTLVSMSGGWGCGACRGANPDGTRFCGHCGAAAASSSSVGAQADERRLITALFADISGFTTLADRLETEQLHEVISPVITRLAAVAERYGGTIAKYAGDALLVFFGAPVAVEDHAERALHVALDMHGELARIVPTLDADAQGLTLHVGVNTGHVVAGMFGGDGRSEYSILGDATNMAQRLESNAPAGETYVGESTVLLAGERFELESVGELSLKGKPLPVPAWRLVGRRDAGADREHAPPARLVGRAEELAALRAVVEGDAKSVGGLAAIVGEPGVGKSRLAEEVRASAEAGGTRWLEARCSPYAAGVAYWPYLDLIRRAFDLSIDQDPTVSARLLADALADLDVAGALPYFARLLALPLPPGAEDVEALEPSAFRRGLHEAARAVLTALADDAPLVLAIEDLHWCDATSIELTTELAALCATHRMTIHLTSRPEGAPVVDTVMAAVPDVRAATITLRPLGPDDTARLLVELLGDTPSRELVQQVAERTGGNPFFAQELVSSLREARALVHDTHGWRVASQDALDRIPTTVEGVLAARMDLLPRAPLAVLQTAAAIGRRVYRPLLEASIDDLADVAGALDHLVRNGFVDRDPRTADTFVFRHALVVDVAYGRLVRRQRCEVHRRIGEAAEVLYGTSDDVVELLARHFRLAEAGVKAAVYLERAASRARRLFANEEASGHLAGAIEIARTSPRLESRLPLLVLERADVEDLMGHFDVAEMLYVEVRDATGDVRAWRGQASVLRRRGDLAGALALIDEAFRTETLRDADVSPLWLERSRVLFHEGRYHDVIESSQAGLACTDDATGPIAAQLLLQSGHAHVSLRRFDDARRPVETARDLFERAGDVSNLAVALRVLGALHSDAGEYDAAASAYHRSLGLAERTGNVEEAIACLVNLGVVALRRGDHDSAIAYTEQALAECERIGHSIGLAVIHVNLADMLLVRGDVDAAFEACRTGLTMASAIGTTWTVADAHRILAAIHLRQGLPRQAAASAREAASLFSQMGDDANVAVARALERDADRLSAVD